MAPLQGGLRGEAHSLEVDGELRFDGLIEHFLRLRVRTEEVFSSKVR